MSIASKQNLIYSILVLATLITTPFFYYILQDQWVNYRNAEISYTKKEYDKAIRLYDLASKAGVPFERIAKNLANSYVTLGNFDEAIAIYKKYLDLYPKDKEMRLEYAKTLTWARHFKEADAEYQKLLESN